MNGILKEFEFGKPWRYSEKSLGIIVPILRHSRIDRNYIMLEEAGKNVVLDETGSIRTISFTNNTGKNVFVRGYTMLQGQGTQSRVVKSGLVLPSGVTEEIPQVGVSPVPVRTRRHKPVKVPVEVNCIAASTPIVGNSTLTCMGWDKGEGYGIPRSVEYSLLSSHTDADGQSRTWNAVSDYRDRASMSCYYEVGSPVPSEIVHTDDLTQIEEKIGEAKTSFDDVVAKVPMFKDQVGVVILDIKGIMGLEVFDSTVSWKVYAKGTIKKYGDILAKEDESGLFEPKMGKIEPIIKSFCENLLKSKRSTLFQNKIAKTTALEGKAVLGEITMLQGRMIHLLAARKEEEPKTRRTSTRRTLSGPYFSEIPRYRTGDTTWGTGDIIVGGEQDRPITTSEYGVYGIPRYTSLKRSPRTYFKGKKSIDFLSSLEKRGKSWGELEKDTQMSSRTLSKNIFESKLLDFVSTIDRANGKTVYKLTDRGKNELELARLFYQS